MERCGEKSLANLSLEAINELVVATHKKSKHRKHKNKKNQIKNN